MVTKATRDFVRERARSRCEYCRAPEIITGGPFEVDHIVPQASAGGDEPENLALCCGDTARRALLDQATVRLGHRVLDIGCGTGTFATFYPDVDVVGLDPDPKALARAKRKAERAAVSIQLDQGFSDELPYAEASFDRIAYYQASVPMSGDSTASQSSPGKERCSPR